MTHAELDAAIAAKDAEKAATLLAALTAAGDNPRDAKQCSDLINLLAFYRKNSQAHGAYLQGKAALGAPALIGAGLSLNALLYACCREAALLEAALALWEEMATLEVKPAREPAGKLILAAVAAKKYEEAFGVFLGAIDAGLQPATPVCVALVRTAATLPRLAQSAYAVHLSIKASGAALPAEALAQLLSACVEAGTHEQCHALYKEFFPSAAGAARATPPPPPSALLRLALRLASTSSAAAASAAAVLRQVRADTPAECAGETARAAYEATFGALAKSALSKSNPSLAASAHAVLTQMRELQVRDRGLHK